MKKTLITLFIMIFSFTSVAFAQQREELMTNFQDKADYIWSGAGHRFIPDPTGENLWYDSAHTSAIYFPDDVFKIQIVATKRWEYPSRFIFYNNSTPEQGVALNVYTGPGNMQRHHLIRPGESLEFKPPYDQMTVTGTIGVVWEKPKPPDPEPDQKPETKPDSEPDIGVGEPPKGGVEKTDGKFFHVPVNMPVIGQYASDLIKVASPYLWLFAVVFFGLIILAVLKRVFTR